MLQQHACSGQMPGLQSSEETQVGISFEHVFADEEGTLLGEPGSKQTRSDAPLCPLLGSVSNYSSCRSSTPKKPWTKEHLPFHTRRTIGHPTCLSTRSKAPTFCFIFTKRSCFSSCTTQERQTPRLASVVRGAVTREHLGTATKQWSLGSMGHKILLAASTVQCVCLEALAT